MTEFLEDHPGGEEVLLHASGMVFIFFSAKQTEKLHIGKDLEPLFMIFRPYLIILFQDHLKFFL